jgi:hypothetical protein
VSLARPVDADGAQRTALVDSLRAHLSAQP